MLIPIDSLLSPYLWDDISPCYSEGSKTGLNESGSSLGEFQSDCLLSHGMR